MIISHIGSHKGQRDNTTQLILMFKLFFYLILNTIIVAGITNKAAIAIVTAPPNWSVKNPATSIPNNTPTRSIMDFTEFTEARCEEGVCLLYNFSSTGI